MATADQLKALIRSHGEQDDTRFYSVALQVAARAAKGGQNRLAVELRDLVDELRKLQPDQVRREGRLTPVAQPKGELAELLSVTYPKVGFQDLAFDDQIASRLNRVVAEQRQADQLRQHGFAPSRRLLLVGPPGTGKTMSAAALAGELRLPLFTIRLDGLLTKFLGETSSKLRTIFDALARTRAVYLFDEVDALGGDRAAANDVGEIRRVLNSFLQFLESDESESLLVAATNHPQLLDKALFRRFDVVIDYPLPDARVAREVIKARLSAVPKSRFSWSAIEAAAEGLSHGEIAVAVNQAAKDAILSGDLPMSTSQVVGALKARQSDR